MAASFACPSVSWPVEHHPSLQSKYIANLQPTEHEQKAVFETAFKDGF
jgi:hypothetical protein